MPTTYRYEKKFMNPEILNDALGMQAKVVGVKRIGDNVIEITTDIEMSPADEQKVQLFLENRFERVFAQKGKTEVPKKAPSNEVHESSKERSR